MDAGQSIAWDSVDSHVFMNPKLPVAEVQTLTALSQEFHQPGHIWIASSGSTQKQNESLKLVALAKSAILESAKAVNNHLSVTANDRWLLSLPTFHIGGLAILARAWLQGNEVIQLQSWQPEKFCQLLAEQNVSLCSVVPTQIFDLLQAQLRAPKNLRALLVGGGQLSDELYGKAIDLGWPLLPSFGMTEACSQIATAALGSWVDRDRQLKILPHWRCRRSSTHELELSGPSLLTGYAQKCNQETVWREPVYEGWYRTEDIVEIDNGYLRPLGRSQDYIKVLGEGVNLQSLQAKLDHFLRLTNPQLTSQSQLRAIADDRLGAKITIFVKADYLDPHRQSVQNSIRDFNLQVAPFERILDIQPTSHLSWKRL